MTQILLAKEIEQTKSIPLISNNIFDALKIIKTNDISLAIIDLDLLDLTLFSSLLIKEGIGIPVVTTSTFFQNKKLSDENSSVLGFLKKPLGYQGYKNLRTHIKSLKTAWKVC